MSKATFIIIGIIVLCFGGLVTWSVINSKQNAINFSEYDSSGIIPPSDSNGQIGDHIRGDVNSSVILIEYADFQCPGCASIQPSISALYAEFGDRVAFIFRNFPIAGHQNSRAAASAAEAAGRQGYFFEMVDTLFSNQAVWTYAKAAERTKEFVNLFRQIAPGGDVNKFKADMSNPAISKKINFDYGLGSEVDKVTGTPTFFLNGEAISVSGTTSTEIIKMFREKLNAKLIELGLTPVEESEE